MDIITYNILKRFDYGNNDNSEQELKQQLLLR